MSTDYTLAYGTHATPEDGRCAMEWVAHLAGEPHSDEPACVSTVLRAFCTTMNDSLGDGPRQRLRPYLARTIGTATDGLDGERSWMAMDWLIRTYAPVWLDVAGVDASAARLAACRPVTDVPPMYSALSVLGEARRDARAVWSAALGAPRATVWAASWNAGRAAARETAWASAAAAAWAAARVAVGDMAGDHARAHVRQIAGDCAAAVARGTRAAGGRAAASESARAALAPTVQRLQGSAFELLDRMLPTVPVLVPVEADGERGRSTAMAVV